MNALILVDIQNDFLPDGTLAVKDGDKILPVVNQLLEHDFDLVIATKDWHSEDHGSFAVNHPNKQVGDVINLEGLEQILWPVHCIQNSLGAEFSPDWHSEKVEKIFYKGTDKKIDSYSTFFDNGHRKSTGVEDYLRAHNVENIYMAGLATDYCVKYSVLDALKLGFHVYVIADACRGVELQSGDTERALIEMQEAGAVVIWSSDILSDPFSERQK